MARDDEKVKLPAVVRGALNAVRRRLRAYVLVEGLALVALVVGAAFWLGLLWDWWLEPSPTSRVVALCVAAGAALFVVYRYVLRRAFVRISDATAATLLERRFPDLRDHVLTAVHLADSPGRAARYHPELVTRTRDAAASVTKSVHEAKLFHGGPLLRALAGATIAVLSVVLFAVLAGDAFGFFMKRLSLANDPWPRRIRLEVVGFPAGEDGRRIERVAAEDNYELLVRARLDGYEAPRMVEIRTRTPDGRRDSDTLIRVGQAVPGRDEFQLYRHEFRRVSGDISFEVLGGDDRVRDLTLEVVDRPELHGLELACEYPAYLNRPPQTLTVTGGMRIPEGTRLALRASSTKPLVGALIHSGQRSQDFELSYAADPVPNLQWDYGMLMDDDVLLVSVTDTDGVTNREPYRISLSVVPDELPQVSVRLPGIGSAITPEARIPFVGKITDEYGLAEAWFEYQVDGNPPMRRAFLHLPQGRLAIEELDAFDLREVDPITGVRPLALVPGQRLVLSVKAIDEYDLSPEPRTGTSPTYSLDVVTASDLLAILERRELELRQRFESIYEKMTDTRNLLSRVDFNDSSEEAGEAAGQGPASAENAAVEPDPSTAEMAADRALARRRLRVAGSLQNIVQSADETLGVAESFDEIFEQLTNNRIDNPDLNARIREQIAVPLRQIGEIRMPELAARVQLVEDRIEDALAGEVARNAAVEKADAVLVEMQQVLERMLELETYNEVLSQLRGIMNEQEELHRKTQERQRNRLRDIFEDDN